MWWGRWYCITGSPAIGLMPHVGIALATSAAGWVNAILLWLALTRRGGFSWDTKLLRNIPIIAVASVLMGLVLWYVMAGLAPMMVATAALGKRVAGLVILVTVGSGVFFGMLMLTGTFRLRQLTGG